MRRDFKVNGVSFTLSDKARSITNTECPDKYDLNMLVAEKGYWVRICSCRTLAEGREKAREYLYELSNCR